MSFVVRNKFSAENFSRPWLAVSVATETSLRLPQVQKNPEQSGFFVLWTLADSNR